MQKLFHCEASETRDGLGILGNRNPIFGFIWLFSDQTAKVCGKEEICLKVVRRLLIAQWPPQLTCH